MKKLNLILAVFLLFTACGKDEEPLPTGIVSTMERINGETTFVQASFADGSRLYFELLSDATAAVVSVNTYYNGTVPLVSYCPENAVIPSELAHNGKTYTVVGIGTEAFHLCYDLITVKLPNTVSYVGSNAFRGCTHLEFLNFTGGLTRIGNGAFQDCAFTSVELNEAITRIPPMAFAFCDHLLSVTLPHIDTIREDGFLNCTQLSSVELPATIKALYTGAFGGCESLKTVVCRAVNPPAMLVPTYNSHPATSPFFAAPIKEIRVPEGSVEAYKAAPGWDSYADKIVGITSKH